MDPRRKARESALQILYSVDLTNGWHNDSEGLPLPPDPGNPGQVFTRRLVDGVCRQRGEVDDRIQSFAKNWHLSRMNLIDRNLLRMAAFELLFCDDIPAKVSINEALELAKTYGTPETTRFLNGILDKIAREKIRPGI
jgi:transcription antitermination protein NusB